MDDFECGTSPAGHSAVVLALGRGFGYPGTDRSAWPGHIGRHGAVAGRRAGVGGAVHSGRQASGRAWPTHGAGPSVGCLGRQAGFRGRGAGLQRRWQHFFFCRPTYRYILRRSCQQSHTMASVASRVPLYRDPGGEVTRSAPRGCRHAPPPYGRPALRCHELPLRRTSEPARGEQRPAAR